MIDPNKLYKDLMELTDHPESGFYYRDEQVGDVKFRIFLYRITSYQWWCKPGALYSRGTVYDITDPENPVLASLCIPKFFNIGENPMAVRWDELDLVDVKSIKEKFDGSLITVFGYRGQTYVKSKGSFSSEQAVAARALVGDNDYLDGISSNYEYCSPSNLIVVRYPHSTLTLLNTVDLNGSLTIADGTDYLHEHSLGEFIEKVKSWKELRRCGCLRQRCPNCI